MRRYLLVAVMAVAIACHAQWLPDRFLADDGFEMRTVRQPDDYSGPVVSTIIKKPSACGGHRGVLYVHGYNDYFFQEEMADRFVDSCYNFYAVDLRKYGRSLLSGQRRYEVREISEYYADIDSALVQMRRDGIDCVVLMGHSTGGLVAASYMADVRPEIVKALILNSPFLDWNFKGLMKSVAIPAVAAAGRWLPDVEIPQGSSSAYAESLLADHHGEWTYDTSLKLSKPAPVQAGWVRAITRAQKRLHGRPQIDVPILLMHSDNSVYGDEWTEAHSHGDAVLSVADIEKWGKRLGPHVTEMTVEGGLHDLFLSRSCVRRPLYRATFRWLNLHSPCHPQETSL